MRRLIVPLCLAALPTISSAQVRCTMPNGKTIEQRLATTCPAGAVRGETLDGTPIAIKLPPQPKATQPAQLTAKPTAAPAPAYAATAYDDALLICHILISTNNATTCDLDSNVFSASVIDATTNAGPRGASKVCSDIKTEMQKARRPIVSGQSNWEIRFFSPYGSADRPIARCVL